MHGSVAVFGGVEVKHVQCGQCGQYKVGEALLEDSVKGCLKTVACDAVNNSALEGAVANSIYQPEPGECGCRIRNPGGSIAKDHTAEITLSVKYPDGSVVSLEGVMGIIRDGDKYFVIDRERIYAMNQCCEHGGLSAGLAYFGKYVAKEHLG